LGTWEVDYSAIPWWLLKSQMGVGGQGKTMEKGGMQCGAMGRARASGRAAEGEKLDRNGDTVGVPTSGNQNTAHDCDCLLVAAQVIRVTSRTVKMGSCNGRVWENFFKHEPADS
jgi:hypothetical protein